MGDDHRPREQRSTEGSDRVVLRPFPDPAEVQGDAFPVIDTSQTKIIVKLDSVAPTIDISPTQQTIVKLEL